MTKYITILFFMLLGAAGFSQNHLLDSVTLANYQEYTDLQAALSNPDDVIKLSLRRKKYKTFPKDIYKFRNLQYLDLSKNALKELPDSIVTLKDLQYLIVSRNNLEALPRNIGDMKNLRHLNVNQNEISVLPFSFGDLENLEVADLWSNNLAYFPESLGKLKNLRMMDLRNILIPQVHQDNIQSMLPHTTIFFSPPCNCSW